MFQKVRDEDGNVWEEPEVPSRKRAAEPVEVESTEPATME